MTQSEKESILSLIDSFRDFDVEAELLKVFPDAHSHDKILLSRYTIEQFAFNLRKCLRFLESELKSSNGVHLPLNYNHPEQGNRNIYNDLNSLISQCRTSTFDINAENFLYILIGYEIDFGFWEKSKIRMHPVSDEEIAKNNSRLKTLYAESERIIARAQSVVSDLKREEEKLVNLIEAKKQEFDQLTSLLNTANSNSNQISELVSTSSVNNEKINNILVSASQKTFDALKKLELDLAQVEETKKSLDVFEKKLAESTDQLETKVEYYEQKLDGIKETEKYISVKKEEIENLTGFAAGVSLFHTFQERKKQLERPTQFWLWAIISATTIVVVGIYVIFSFNPVNITLKDGTVYTNWGEFALNSLKSFPLFLLLYFAINQYVKERSFQEEYAFKSAVALTINAYADKLAANNKDALILSAVEKVYQTPTMMKERMKGLVSLRSRDIAESLKSLNETLKGMKN